MSVTLHKSVLHACNVAYHQGLTWMTCSSGRFKGGEGGANEPPFGQDIGQRSTGDRLNGTPLFKEETCFYGSPQHALAKISIENGLTSRVRSFSQEYSKMGMILTKIGAWHKNFACASCIITTTFQ